MLWSPSVMRKLGTRRITLDPKACDGYKLKLSTQTPWAYDIEPIQ
jgi:hypothetical protein